MPEEVVAVFGPDNEPYLGRISVLALDKAIVACLELNRTVAPLSRKASLTPYQAAACQLIPQAIHLVLATRELVRQGYLFGALTMRRPLWERIAILLYLEAFPELQPIWDRGWNGNEAPSLAAMLERIGGVGFAGLGRDMTGPLNAVLHGKPASAAWTTYRLPDGTFGHGVSKILNKPEMCDDVCVTTAGLLAVLIGAMAAVFPGTDVA